MRKQQKTNIYSKDIHSSTPRSSGSASSSLSKKISLFAIITAMLLVIVAIFSVIFFNNENQIKREIAHLATDYYENYFYEDFTNSEKFAKIDNLDEAMQKYTEHGFARVTLRQLLLHNADQNSETAAFLREYCDENKTSIQIFPEPPFEKTSYHIKYTYSCNF